MWLRIARSIKIMLATDVAYYYIKLEKMDVKIYIFHVELEEIIYMEQSKGFIKKL